MCKLICNFLSIQFDENESESDTTTMLDSSSFTNRTLTNKTDTNLNKKSVLMSEKETIKKNRKSLKLEDDELDKEKHNRLLYEKKMKYLENFASILDLPKFFTDLLKQFVSQTPASKHLKEVILNDLKLITPYKINKASS